MTYVSAQAQLSALHPTLFETERVLGCQAGVRSLPPRSHHGYVPIAGRLGPAVPCPMHECDMGSTDVPAGAGQCLADVWCFGGLGSRGLIHHALLGRFMGQAVLRRDESLLHEHTRRMHEALAACSPRTPGA